MSNAIEYAMLDIAELHRDGHISAEMAQRARDAVDLLFDNDTVYASVAPDGGDVLFYWRAGKRSVSIDLYADPAEGDSWGSAVDGAGHRWTYNSSATRPDMRQHLRQFSEYVEMINPDWRELLTAYREEWTP